MTTIPELISAVQSDLNSVNSAAMTLASTSAALFAAEANYQTALTAFNMAWNSGNQQMINMAASILAAANSTALTAESNYQAAVATFMSADNQLQADRAALNAALQGMQTPRKEATA